MTEDELLSIEESINLNARTASSGSETWRDNELGWLDVGIAPSQVRTLIAEVRRLRNPPSTVFEVPYGEMNDVLFDLCREDDYRGIYMEIIRRLDEGVKP